jgi:hypothetical protein
VDFLRVEKYTAGSIPVQPGREDVIAWHFDNKGVFSDKSVYHTLHDQSI